MSKEMLHYTMSGLPNIYLANGYKWHETKRGKGLVVADVDGLHRAIGLHIVETKRALTNLEFRFLRLNMLVSQANLASLMDTEEQNIGRWERNETKIPGPAGLLLKAIYLTHIDDKDFSQLLDEFAELDNQEPETKTVFTDESGEWEVAA